MKRNQVEEESGPFGNYSPFCYGKILVYTGDHGSYLSIIFICLFIIVAYILFNLNREIVAKYQHVSVVICISSIICAISYVMVSYREPGLILKGRDPSKDKIAPVISEGHRRIGLIMACIANDKKDLVHELLDSNPDLVNVCNIENRSLMHTAVMLRKCDYVKLLLEYNPDIDIKDSFKMKCIHYAAFNDDLNICKLLFDYMGYQFSEEEMINEIETLKRYVYSIIPVYDINNDSYIIKGEEHCIEFQSIDDYDYCGETVLPKQSSVDIQISSNALDKDEVDQEIGEVPLNKENIIDVKSTSSEGFNGMISTSNRISNEDSQSNYVVLNSNWRYASTPLHQNSMESVSISTTNGSQGNNACVNPVSDTHTKNDGNQSVSGSDTLCSTSMNSSIRIKNSLTGSQTLSMYSLPYEGETAKNGPSFCKTPKATVFSPSSMGNSQENSEGGLKYINTRELDTHEQTDSSIEKKYRTDSIIDILTSEVDNLEALDTWKEELYQSGVDYSDNNRTLVFPKSLTTVRNTVLAGTQYKRDPTPLSQRRKYYHTSNKGSRTPVNVYRSSPNHRAQTAVAHEDSTSFYLEEKRASDISEVIHSIQLHSLYPSDGDCTYTPLRKLHVPIIALDDVPIAEDESEGEKNSPQNQSEPAQNNEDVIMPNAELNKSFQEYLSISCSDSDKSSIMLSQCKDEIILDHIVVGEKSISTSDSKGEATPVEFHVNSLDESFNLPHLPNYGFTIQVPDSSDRLSKDYSVSSQVEKDYQSQGEGDNKSYGIELSLLTNRSGKSTSAFPTDTVITQRTYLTPGSTSPKSISQPLLSYICIYNDQIMTLRRCKRCHLYIPPRGFHCRICDSCIRCFDHHCSWIGNCVGIRNHLYFVVFLTACALFFIFSIILSVMYIIHLFKELATITMWLQSCWPYALFTVCSLVVLIPLLNLLSFHLYLISSNCTAHEFLSIPNKKQRKKQGLTRRDVFIYTKGFLKNWIQQFRTLIIRSQYENSN